MKLIYKRYRQLINFGWKNAKEIASSDECSKSRIPIFLDILKCFRKYYLFSNQYTGNKLWQLSGSDRDNVALPIGNLNRQKDTWVDTYYDNWRFMGKYSDLRWFSTRRGVTRLNKAYKRHYHLPDTTYFQYGVTIICEHFSIGKLSVGENVLFARDVDIDYTGDLTIGDHVKFSEGTKILTHNHPVETQILDDDSQTILTPLTIEDNVGFGARACVMPGTTLIGRGANISTGAVIRHPVPPYAIMMGNPARVVGFRYTPDQIIELEQELYPEEKRLSEKVLRDNYQKYYLDRLPNIAEFLRK